MKKQLGCIFLTLTLLSCNSKDKKGSAGSGPDTSNLTVSMQSLKENLSRLLPLVLDAKTFSAPENQETILKSVKNLSSISQGVEHNQAMNSQDPTLRFVSNAFSEELKRADESLSLGKREFARYTLMNVTAYCIECHTRTSKGPSFQSETLNATLTRLPRMERAEYLVATRQFPEALKEFQAEIQSELREGGNYFELDRALRYSLSVTVKYLRDPKKSMELLKTVISNKKTPYYLANNAKAWMKSLQEWSKEKPIDLSKSEAIMGRARSLVQKGKQLASMGTNEGDIQFLRALSDLHLALNLDLNQEQKGEVLFLMGNSYEQVRDLAVWNLHESYYEACIKQVPRSKWGRMCFQDLKASVVAGYTGTGTSIKGPELPLEEQTRLDELEKKIKEVQ